jgi:hypothetical protein
VRGNAETASQSVQKVIQASGTVAENAQALDSTLSELLGGLRSNGG